jgi:hypothetical protein
MDKLLSSYLFKKYKCTWLTVDLELWPSDVWKKLCFCPRCRAAFKEYCLSRAPAFAERDPGAEVLSGKDQDFLKIWDEFKGETHARVVRDLTRPVGETVTGCEPTSPWEKFTVAEWCKPKKHLLDTIDIFEVGLYYTPDIVMRHFEEMRGKWGESRKNLIATYTFGQSEGCPDFHMRASQIRDLVYEAAIYGARGVIWFYYIYIEPERAKYMLDGIRSILPVEDIILDGAITATAKSSAAKLLVTKRDLAGESLVAVRSYGAGSDVTGAIKLENLSAPVTVRDCGTGESIAEISPEKPFFNISMAKDSCRLLYIGTEAQWKNRQK